MVNCGNCSQRQEMSSVPLGLAMDLQKSDHYASKCGLFHQPLKTATYGALVKQMVGGKNDVVREQAVSVLL